VYYVINTLYAQGQGIFKEKIDFLLKTSQKDNIKDTICLPTTNIEETARSEGLKDFARK